MEGEEYICLECGHVWTATAERVERCGSGKGCSLIMPLKRYNQMLDKLAKIVNDNTPFIDRYNAFKELLFEYGILKERPKKLWDISEKLVKEAEARQEVATRGQITDYKGEG